MLLLSRMAPFVCLATAYILQQCYCKWLRNNYDSLFVATVTLMFTDGSKITRWSHTFRINENEIFTKHHVKRIVVFWNVGPCSLVGAYRKSEAVHFAPTSAHFYDATQQSSLWTSRQHPTSQSIMLFPNRKRHQSLQTVCSQRTAGHIGSLWNWGAWFIHPIFLFVLIQAHL